jgi:hypothetical protein
MALPSLLSFKGGKLSGVALTGADIKSILPKVTDRPYTIIFYHDIPDKLIDGINVILFIYPGASYGHWCFLDINKAAKKIYFSPPMAIRLMANGLFLITQRRGLHQNLNYQNTSEI